MCYCPTPTLHLNLALTGDGAFLFSLKKTHSVWFISVLYYGDTENVLINHLLLVIPVSYPCHYTNLCPHKPHKHAHTHTHTHTHTLTHFIRYTLLVPGYTPLCLHNYLNSLWHRFNKVLETFLRDFGHIVMIASHSYCRFVVCTSMMRILSDPNTNFECNNQRQQLTALWSDGIQASSEWEYSSPVMLGHPVGAAFIFQGVRTTLDHNPVKM